MNKKQIFFIIFIIILYILHFYYIVTGTYTIRGLLITLTPLLANIGLLIVSIIFINKKEKQSQEKIKEHFENIEQEAKKKLFEEHKRLDELEKKLMENEKKLLEKEEKWIKQLSLYGHSLQEKNNVIKKIKQVAYNNSKNEKNRLEEIKRRLYDY